MSKQERVTLDLLWALREIVKENQERRKSGIPVARIANRMEVIAERAITRAESELPEKAKTND